MPEFLVSIISTLKGSVELGTGNAVGSVACNIGLIMAILLIFLPGIIKKREIIEKGSLLIISVAALLLLSLGGTLTLAGAIILYILFALFICLNLASMKNRTLPESASKQKPPKKEVASNIVKFILGAAGIIVGAKLLVDNGSSLAKSLGVSEAIVGLTVIAIGTLLPELVTTITALIKKESSMSVGNILGANIIDLTLILSTGSVLSKNGLPVYRNTIIIDLPFVLALSAVAVIPPMFCGKFRKWQGFALLLIYIAYLLITIISA